MAEPGNLPPPVPLHLSTRSPVRNVPQPPPSVAKKPPQVTSSGRPPPPPRHPHQHHASPLGGSGVQDIQLAPFSRPADEAFHKSVSFKQPWKADASDVEINMEPSESEDGDQNQPDDSDLDDDNLSSISKSSHSSVVSNAPSVQHFNISFVFKKTFREHEGARAFHSIRAILKAVYMCTLRFTYNTLLFTFGIMVAFIWAVINGAVAFLQAWFVSPLTRVSLVIVKGVLPLILDPLSLILKACAQGCCGVGGLGGGAAGAGGVAGGGLQGAMQGMARLKETFRQ